MKSLTNAELIKKAKEIVKVKKVSDLTELGAVGCALVTDKGTVFVGVSIHTACGIGFCAEHSAIASMITNQEYKIAKIVAVGRKGNVLPPCGRCRELMLQINEKNLGSEVIIGKNKVEKLKKLLPNLWQKCR